MTAPLGHISQSYGPISLTSRTLWQPDCQLVQRLCDHKSDGKTHLLDSCCRLRTRKTPLPGARLNIKVSFDTCCWPWCVQAVQPQVKACARARARPVLAVSESPQHNGDVRKQRGRRCGGTLLRSCRLKWILLLVWSEAMEVAPAVSLLLCVSLRVSLAANWEFVDTHFTHRDDALDYKDPCKAGRACLPPLCNYWWSGSTSGAYIICTGSCRLLVWM